MADYTDAQKAAIDRLDGYNSNEVSSSNPQGFANGGHRVNFPAALSDTAQAAKGMSTVAQTLVSDLTKQNKEELQPILLKTEQARDAALASSNFKGSWTTMTGELKMPASVYYDGKTYNLLKDIPDVTKVIPGTDDTVWALAGSGGGVTDVIPAPKLIAPAEGATNVVLTPTLQAGTYRNVYGEARTFRDFQVDLQTGDFSSPVYTFSGNMDTHAVITILAQNKPMQWRARDRSSNDTGEWAKPVKFTTGTVSIATPTLTVEGEPDAVGSSPKLTGGSFEVVGGSDTHAATDWRALKKSDGSVVWESLNDTTNKTTITVPNGKLAVSTEYTFMVRYKGVAHGYGGYGSKDATTKSQFSIAPKTNSVISGALGVGVTSICESRSFPGTFVVAYSPYGGEMKMYLVRRRPDGSFERLAETPPRDVQMYNSKMQLFDIGDNVIMLASRSGSSANLIATFAFITSNSITLDTAITLKGLPGVLPMDAYKGADGWYTFIYTDSSNQNYASGFFASINTYGENKTPSMVNNKYSFLYTYGLAFTRSTDAGVYNGNGVYPLFRINGNSLTAGCVVATSSSAIATPSNNLAYTNIAATPIPSTWYRSAPVGFNSHKFGFFFVSGGKIYGASGKVSIGEANVPITFNQGAPTELSGLGDGTSLTTNPGIAVERVNDTDRCALIYVNGANSMVSQVDFDDNGNYTFMPGVNIGPSGRYYSTTKSSDRNSVVACYTTENNIHVVEIE